MELSEEIMYQALQNKDPEFEGLFFAAVKTTGIFCRPTCTAKKPKPENVGYFQTTREAILNGYRPCKVCSPLEKAGYTPDYIRNLLAEIIQTGKTFSDDELKKRGIEPSALRRWFKKFHGLTFHSYQRMLRINTAFKKIQNGSSVTEAAFDSGFESLSSFNESFKSTFGISPSQSRNKKVINFSRIETVLGPLFACATENGICLLEFTERRMLETELQSLTKLFDATIIHGENQHISELKTELEEYFSGSRKEFSVRLDTPGSEFQKSVWKELLNIPYGNTRSYKEQSVALGKPGAVRAVANANGMNRISILIPCHRVIGEDGHLTGYGGGLWRKKWLLDHEAKFSGKKILQPELQF